MTTAPGGRRAIAASALSVVAALVSGYLTLWLVASFTMVRELSESWVTATWLVACVLLLCSFAITLVAAWLSWTRRPVRNRWRSVVASFVGWLVLALGAAGLLALPMFYVFELID